MSDLANELKQRLRIEDVIEQSGAEFVWASRRGRELQGKVHDSLKCRPDRQFFKWHSQGIAGDVFSWIAYRKFGRTQVDGEQFVEVLREACAIVGMEFPERERSNPKQSERRRLEEILERYVSLCESLRDAEFYVRAKQRKGWLTAEVCERWRLGRSATPAEWRGAGLTDDEMKAVGLYVHSQERKGEWYAFFRDSIVIPTLHWGRVLYLSSRYLSDTNNAGITREKKTLHMRSQELLPRPAGFNLDVLNDPETRKLGLRLVEGPLDAVRACELGRPSVAMYGSTPSEELVRFLKRSA